MVWLYLPLTVSNASQIYYSPLPPPPPSLSLCLSFPFSRLTPPPKNNIKCYLVSSDSTISLFPFQISSSIPLSIYLSLLLFAILYFPVTVRWVCSPSFLSGFSFCSPSISQRTPYLNKRRATSKQYTSANTTHKYTRNREISILLLLSFPLLPIFQDF